MKKIGLLLGTLLLLLLAHTGYAQSLACNDFITVSLDENCSFTLMPEHVLEGFEPDNCVVEIDKTPPSGNGPWVPGNLGVNDIGNVYVVRVRHVPSGVMCWGNVETVDKLKPVLACEGFSTVSLNGGGPVNVATNTLSITASDACSNVTLSPASLAYDCPDLGVHIVQLSATDAYNNTRTCSHTVLVTDGDNCEACVSECPASLNVSYDEGNNDLLADFLNNNWAAFEPYGNALFNVTCNYMDSSYTIDYQPGTAGVSWFTRRWQWTDAGGDVTACEQAILFPRTHTVTVQGRVYIDTDTDCVSDAGEQGVGQYPIVVTRIPSGTTSIIYPQSDGTYSAEIIFDVQDASAELSLTLPPFVNPVCPTALNVPNLTGNPSVVFDMGLQSAGDCPRMQVDIGNLFIRRCGTNSFMVKYCNEGLDTAYNAVVTVDLDALIDIIGASETYTVSGPEELITFEIGDVAPFECGTINIQALVSCDAIPGQTLCNEATITPSAPCDGAWQGAEIEASAACVGDSVQLILTNKGPGDMSIPLNYIVVEDFIMYRDGSFHLAANESVTITVPSNGATWRIEAQQENGYPNAAVTVAAIEGCGGINVLGLINALGVNDNGIGYDQYCGVVVASCDPNDKNAVPVGAGADQIIRANEWIEYKIRFQNTGTDTAFRVVVVDTLSPLLNAGSIELGAASHPYRLDIFPGGILNFVFDPIALPDSNVNEPASHGFLEFRIAQQPDLPDGTRLENTVAIYFDQNEPVFTNTAFHTVGYPFTILPPLEFTAEGISPTCHGAADGVLVIHPEGGLAPYTFTWSNPALQGDSLNNLTAGQYHLTITDSRGMTQSSTFVLVEPELLQLALEASPTLGNDNNGTASAQAVGGTIPYTWLWNNSATTQQISGLPAGVYSVVITDANGCTQQGAIEVQQNVLPLFVASITTPVLCNGSADGAIALNVYGGLSPYSFTWAEPGLEGDSPSGLAAGLYHLTITDQLGAQFSEAYQITEPASITPNLSAVPTTGNDNSGSVSSEVAGGTAPYTWLWNNGATTQQISGLPAGVYSVVITDSNGCTQSAEAVVQQTVLPLTAQSETLDPLCFGSANGAIAVHVSGGLSPYTFTWNAPGVEGDSPSGLTAGTYQVTISDNFGGEIVETLVLNDPAPVAALISSTPSQAGAPTGTATVQASGGTPPYLYVWSNGATTSTVTELTAGTYTVEITDAHGCTDTESVVVEQTVSSSHPDDQAPVRIQPNPAHDRITVALHGSLADWSRLDLLSADGRLLQRIAGSDLTPEFQLSLNAVHHGGFIVLVLHRHDGSLWSGKVLVH